MSSGNNAVRAKLDELRDSPAGTETASEEVLGLIYEYLIKGADPPKAAAHWFCSRADQTTVDAATFLIRLHAYNSPRVDIWRSHLQLCLRSCLDCIKAYQEAKVTSRHTFFGAFNDEILEPFFNSLSDWEATEVLKGLSESGVTPTSLLSSGRTLADAPPSLVFHALSNLRILHDPKFLSILTAFCPTQALSGWGSDVPPPGLLLLLMHQSDKVRAWALKQIVDYQKLPMKSEHFFSAYVEVLGEASGVIGRFDAQSRQVVRTADSLKDIFPFAQDTSTLWSGYCTLLRFVPPERFAPSDTLRMDLRHIVIGHLSDVGAHFIGVLKTFLLILNRVRSGMWKGESPQYPLVVFNVIKDNPKYIEFLQSDSGSVPDHWILTCLQPYLKSLEDLPAFREVLPVMIQFLCEELQHDRFRRVQPNAIVVASRMLYAILSTGSTPKAVVEDLNAAREWLDIHAARFVAVAFGKLFTSELWKDARPASRNAIKAALNMDLKNALTTLTQLSIPVKHKEVVVPIVREQVWKEIYQAIHHDDTEGVATILSILAQISHVDTPSETAFSGLFKYSTHPDMVQKAFSSVDSALRVFRNGFSDAISRVLDFSTPSSMTRLLRQHTVIQNLVVLMFSPVVEIREAAQAAAGLALDVETRQDCFRALLSTHPTPALHGIFNILDTFIAFAPVVPEACSLSKYLALCLTDIIDVLCTSPDGLLLQQDFPSTFGSPGAVVELPKWWNLMTKALSLIFHRTPRWAAYFENSVMILWMRDALIFGRDLLAQRRVVETGALWNSQQPVARRNRSLSHLGKKMVEDLQPVLQELSKWLRLTDEELLFQSFALLQSLLECFRESEVLPLESTMQKLQKYVDDARKKDPSRPQTRLDAPRLARLQESLSSFGDDDDEVQVISHTKPSKPPLPTKPAREQVKQELAPAPKPAKTTVVPSARQPATKAATRFTAEDQKKLESASTLPKFTSTTKTSLSAVSKEPQIKTEPPTRSTADSSSSESDSDEESGLASLVKIQRTPTVKKPAERRQVKMLDLPMNGKNATLERISRKDDARRTGLRLKPDISSLHRKVLSWTYDHTGPDPPGEKLQLIQVPDTFSDIQHYRRIFEPLLLSECWAQIQHSKEEPQDKYACRIVSRQYTDDWLDLEILLTETVRKDWYLADTDIVLLATPGSPKSHMGKVLSSRAQVTGIQCTIRILAGGQDGGPQIGANWTLTKVFSLTTLHREYAALMGLPYYDLCHTIMRPELAKSGSVDPPELRRTMSEYKLNEPQAKAILNSMSTEGFSLIQGPPGTGKTSTICGLVQMFLSRRHKPPAPVYVGRGAGPAEKEPPKKILLCAPSNAAIDEITYRLKEGTSGAGRKDTLPKVVRVGAAKSMNVSVKDVSLDSLVEQKLNADPTSKGTSSDAHSEIALLRSELESVRKQRTRVLEEITNTHDNLSRTTTLEGEIKSLNKRRLGLTHQLDRLKDKQKSDARTLDAVSRRYRMEVMQEADVICSTLSGAGHELLEAFDFEMVVIDEAAQAIELSSLIPLKYRCGRCIMVGDPQQLPPTVISQEATKYSYNQSLFVRLQKRRPDAVHLLSIQYRMHPDISRLPSRVFYAGKLLDGPEMASKTQKPWHSHSKFGTYRFYNVSKGQEQTGSNHSMVNRTESQVAVALYNRLKMEFSSYDFDYKVGVVTMYRAQVGELRKAFEQRFGSAVLGTVDFNTVDGFQGQEKEVIILSCVRAGPGVQNVGFLSDMRRMNVALTRAKSSVFVLGHAATLERSDSTWRAIVADARERSYLVEADVTYFTSVDKPSSQQPARPHKPASKPEKLPPPPPSDLLTPQAMAASSRSSQTMAAPESDRRVDPEQGEPTTRVTPATSDTSRKRPAEDDLPESEGSERRKPQPKQKPPAKRPKPAPSLFIPKKR